MCRVEFKRLRTRKAERALDLKNNACVICHTNNCHPWKFGDKKRINNVNAPHREEIEVDTVTFEDAVDSESEN